MRLKKWLRSYFSGFALAAFLTGIALWRCDFAIDKIQCSLLSDEDPPSSYSIADFVWPKKFLYLNQGAQVFAFESEDGKYVLKFFKRNQLKISNFLSEQKKLRRKEKIRIYPESYRLAIQHLQQETALLAVHQGTTSELYPQVELIDKASRSFSIDLNAVPFVLQKKGEGTFLSHLRQDKVKLWSAIDRFLKFQAKRIDLCIADGDRDIKRNYAWIEDELIYIDPARFSYDERLKNIERRNLEWTNATQRLKRWFAQNAPEQLNALDEKLKEYH